MVAGMSAWRLDGERWQLMKSQAGRKGASRSPWRHNLSLSGSRPDFAKSNKRWSE